MDRIEIHCCATEKSIMSFPMGALCIKTAINHTEGLPHAELFQHLVPDDPVLEARGAVSRRS